jgi:hypothetical protein
MNPAINFCLNAKESEIGDETIHIWCQENEREKLSIYTFDIICCVSISLRETKKL